jgi:hypothetical protein
MIKANEAREPKLSLFVAGAGRDNLFEVAGHHEGQAVRAFVALIRQAS